MVMGGNDGFNVLGEDGQLYGPHDPEWQTEYARRAAVVMRELSSNGKRPVYWVPPPTARDPEFNAIYATQNRAVEQAAAGGARRALRRHLQHDQPTARYSDELKIDGRRVLARQSDGVHFSREGAIVPARLILRAMAKDYRGASRCGAVCGALALLALASWRSPRRRRAEALSRRLLVNGDSLAVGTAPYLPRELRGWKVTQSTAVSRHAFEGADVMRAYGRSLPRVIHVSLGTNDDPSSVEAFRAAIREVMEVAGPRRCVVWTNIVRPPGGRRELRRATTGPSPQESRPRENLRVVNWARMVRENPHWLAGDGVHVSAEGYRARAQAVARSVRRCR